MTREDFKKYVEGEHRPIRVVLERYCWTKQQKNAVSIDDEIELGKIVYNRYVPDKWKWYQIEYSIGIGGTVKINYEILWRDDHWFIFPVTQGFSYGAELKYDQIELAYSDEELKQMDPDWMPEMHQEERWLHNGN